MVLFLFSLILRGFFFVLILLNCVLIGSNFNFDFVLNFVRFFGKDDFDIDC